MIVKEWNQAMEALTLHDNEHAPAAIPLDSANDVFHQLFVLSFPHCAIVCCPEHFCERANGMAEDTEAYPVDRFRVVGLNLSPAK